MKLLFKERVGSKIKKKYDQAKTPFQRVLESKNIEATVKAKLSKQLETLDPFILLENIKKNQAALFQYAWKKPIEKLEIEDFKVTDFPEIQKFNKTKKKRKPLGLRTWRTVKDPLDGYNDKLWNILKEKPHYTAKQILEEFIEENPERFNMSHLRTFQRRIKDWKSQDLHQGRLLEYKPSEVEKRSNFNLLEKGVFWVRFLLRQ